MRQCMKKLPLCRCSKKKPQLGAFLFYSKARLRLGSTHSIDTTKPRRLILYHAFGLYGKGYSQGQVREIALGETGVDLAEKTL